VGIDGNLTVQELLLSPAALEGAVRVLAENNAPAAQLTSARRAIRKAPAARHSLRAATSYVTAPHYAAAVDDLMEGFRAISRARGFRATPSDFLHPRLSPLEPRDLLTAANDPSALGLRAELEAVAAAALEHDPGAVGVSAVYLSQALPAFALAGALRRLGYRGKLALGGGLIGSWSPHLAPDSPLFRVWDVLVAGPGEGALAALAARGSLEGIPGVLSPDAGVWNPSEVRRTDPVAFSPSLEGVPWDRYWAPTPILPLAASRGCYWRRCAFCPESAQDNQPFRRAAPALLRETVLEARDAHGAGWVHLVDNAVPPATLSRLAEGLRGAGVGWYGFARMEKQFLDPAFAKTLAAGGCRMLQLGLETGSQRLLDLMGKGTRIEHAGAVLRNLTRAGIRTYVYLLFGIPTERRDEAEETLNWTVDHAQYITFLNLSIMHLPRGSDLDRSPGRFGLRPVPDEGSPPALSLYKGFGPSDPLARRESRRFLARLRSEPALRDIVRRSPRGFGSNHAAFAPID
jgi:hypothetical protein